MKRVHFIFHSCLLFCVVTTSFGQSCDNNWILRGDKCYFFSTHPDTWVESLRACYQHNADLASIKSAEENTFLESYVKSHNSVYWVGGTSMTINGTWVWIQDNQPLVYDDWYPGEPNNHNNNEHCLELNPNRKWNDEDCLTQKYFICEKNKYVWVTVPTTDMNMS